ncbi:hypothetical protein K458DRAFT_421443 [Lentithecium fluviatile CBS 122367]|uniref:Uncharacterized protein n=1 Tax=Lentithecium fluviatile CBS 122367 TaxID=1168545 RepID=A0A6G1IQI4_9PLEO|nr:hypothetical protein K458DRAFT_421443 [Lentithecium fluviatile CBS 122367]
MSAVTVWFCCNCKTGGYSLVYDTSCPECGHPRSSCCRKETHYTQEYRCGSATLSDCSEVAHEPINIPAAAYPPPASGNASTVNTALNIAHLGFNNSTCLPGSDHNGSTPLTLANLAGLDATYAASVPSNLEGRNNKGPREGGEVVEYYWYCCNCDYGPMNCGLHAGCVNCSNHWRGGCCRVTKVVRYT